MKNLFKTNYFYYNNLVYNVGSRPKRQLDTSESGNQALKNKERILKSHMSVYCEGAVKEYKKAAKANTTKTLNFTKKLGKLNGKFQAGIEAIKKSDLAPKVKIAKMDKLFDKVLAKTVTFTKEQIEIEKNRLWAIKVIKKQFKDEKKKLSDYYYKKAKRNELKLNWKKKPFAMAKIYLVIRSYLEWWYVSYKTQIENLPNNKVKDLILETNGPKFVGGPIAESLKYAKKQIQRAVDLWEKGRYRDVYKNKGWHWDPKDAPDFGMGPPPDHWRSNDVFGQSPPTPDWEKRFPGDIDALKKYLAKKKK